MSNDDVHVLPDGSAFAVVSYPLPKDHWIYGPTGEPPMRFRVDLCADREAMAEMIREAAHFAIRGASMNGRVTDMDPDAIVQNLIVGLLGYWPTLNRSTDDAVVSE